MSWRWPLHASGWLRKTKHLVSARAFVDQRDHHVAAVSTCLVPLDNDKTEMHLTWKTNCQRICFLQPTEYLKNFRQVILFYILHILLHRIPLWILILCSLLDTKLKHPQTQKVAYSHGTHNTLLIALILTILYVYWYMFYITSQVYWTCNKADFDWRYVFLVTW